MRKLRRLSLSRILFMATFAGAGAAHAQAPNPAPTTPEEHNSPGIYRIKAPSIYSQGVSGVGVTAAIVDTGLFAGHPEFASRVLAGFNAIDGSTNVADGNGHGTHVAGIIGAGYGNPLTQGMFGVAYNVSLLPIKALNDRGSGTSASVASGILHAVGRGAFVVNLSLSASSPATNIENALRSAVAANMVVAAAAGNSGAASPHWPARYAKEGWANGQIIAVGAVDAGNVIASWSNRGGDTKDFFIVAPGTAIYSTYTKFDRRLKQYVASYASLSGTSMATPYVTGAAALLKSGWGYLSAPQVTSILFTSATDLGAPGVDEVYGHGLLNLERALQPIGALGTPTSTGATVAVTGTSLTSSAAAGAALQAAAREGLLQVAAFDSYGRDFEVDFAPTLSRTRSVTDALAPMLAAFDAATARTYTQRGTTVRLAYRSETASLGLGHAPALAGAPGPSGGFALSSTDATGRELSFGYLGMGTQAFGLGGELARRGEAQLTSSLGNAYFPLVHGHMHAGVGLPLTEGLRMKLGMLVSEPRAMAQDELQISPRRQSMALGELSGQYEFALWTVGIGRLQESDSVLGATQTGALGLTGEARTTVMNFGTSFSVTERLRLGAQYTVGRTGDLANRADSLVTGYSAGRSEAYAAFAALKQAFRPGDSLSFTVSQPMRMVSGTLQMTVPVRADENGVPVMESRSISLRPEARETRFDLLYIAPTQGGAHRFLGFALRQSPDHDAAAPREAIIAAGIRASF